MNNSPNVFTTNIGIIQSDIDKLKKIKKKRYTALQLHQGRNAMLNRVQRKQDERFFGWAQNQKKVQANKLANQNIKLTTYNTAVSDYEKDLIEYNTALDASKDTKVLDPMTPVLVRPMEPVLSEPMTNPLLFKKNVQTRNKKRRLRQSRYGF